MTQLQPHPYEHAIFKPGRYVYISADILAIHDDSPVAGCFVTVTTGVYYTSDDPAMQKLFDAENIQHTRVPVIARDGTVYDIEQEYVHDDMRREYVWDGTLKQFVKHHGA